MKKRKRQSKQHSNVSPEEIQRIEETLGVKFVDINKCIFKSNGIVWKPVKTDSNTCVHLGVMFRCYKSHQDVPHAISFLWNGNHKIQSK